MTNCNDLIDDFHRRTSIHAHLAVNAEVTAVAEMHIELALFSQEQARIAEALCAEPEA